MKSRILAGVIIGAAALLSACSEDVKVASESFNDMPRAVQKTVRAQAPEAEIETVKRTRRDGAEVYEVEFRQAGERARVVVAPDGTLVQTDLAEKAGSLSRALTPTGATGTPLSALPLEVQKTVQSQAGSSPIQSISRNEVRGRVVYEVEFADRGRNPTLRVAEDGTLVESLSH